MLLEAQGSMRADILSYVRSFDLVGLHLAKPRIGYGLERALYALNPAWPCQSPLLAADYVADLDELLPALERLAAQGKTERPPIDWPVGGFVPARMKLAPDRAFTELTEGQRSNIFNLRIT